MGAADHRELQSVCIGKAVGAVLVHAHGPNICRRVAGQLAVCRERQLRARQILSFVGVKDRIGQAHAVGRIVKNDPIACGNGVSEAARSRGKELQQEGLGIIGGKRISSKIVIVALQIERLTVFCAVHALDIEASLDRFQLPKAVVGGSRRKGKHIGGRRIGSQILSGGIAEGIVAVHIHGNGQLRHCLGHG